MSGFFFVHKGLMLLFITVVVFLIYSKTLVSPFVFDDKNNILKNPHIRLTRLTLFGITSAGFSSPLSNRPTANISFAVNYYFHRYNVVGYHMANILIHITAGILLFIFVETTLHTPSLRSGNETDKWIPFFAAFIWLVHPIQTQSVTYVVQRMNSMCAMFYILSLLFYAKARLEAKNWKKIGMFTGFVIAGIAALGTKEIAGTLPFFTLLYEWYYFQQLSGTWLKRRFFLLVCIFILLALVAMLYLGAHPFDRILSGYDSREFTMPQRVLTQFRVIIFYISLILFPHPSRLNLDHDFSISRALVDPPTTLLAIAGILILGGIAIYLAKKERLLSFCILWFLGNLVIESSVIGLEMVFEHRTYLPSMLVSVLAVVLAYRHIKPKWLCVWVLGVVVLILSIWTYERNRVWNDRISLWKDCVKKSPNKARPHYNLARELESRGSLNEAVHHYFEALRIDPEQAEAHNNLGNVLQKQGKFARAVQHFSEALRIKPDDATVHNNLGVALQKQGNIPEAIRHFSEALRIKPHYDRAHNNIGVAQTKLGNYETAIRHFSDALRIKPDSSEARHNLNVVFKRMAQSNVMSPPAVRPKK